MPRIFVTGFGPFGPIKENPSSWLAERLGHPHQVLEVSFDAVEEFLKGFKAKDYDVLLLIGVHGGADRMHLERVGLNRIGPVPDVRGQKRRRKKIDPAAPERIPATLWPRRLPKDAELRKDVRLSRCAGTYLCNYTLFRALQEFPQLKVGFLHVPPAEKMALEAQLASAKLVVNRLIGDEGEASGGKVSRRPSSR